MSKTKIVSLNKNMVNKLSMYLKRNRSIILYIFWGGITTVINISSFGLFVNFFNMNYQLANFLAWFLTVLAVYFSNKVWVFESNYSTFNNLVKELFTFFIARILTLFLDAIILYIGIQLLRRGNLVVKVVDNIVIVIVNYILSKYFVFKSN